MTTARRQESEDLTGVQDNEVGFNHRLREKAVELFGRHKTGTPEGSGVELATVRQVCGFTGGRTRCDYGPIFWLSGGRLPR